MPEVIFNDEQLIQAVFDRKIVPVFQPIVRLADGQITGAEVLARWHLPDGTAIPPDVFIPRAEALGLILPLTSSLMSHVRQRLSADPRRPAHPFTVGINAGPSCLISPVFEKSCRDFSAHFPTGDIKLAVEVTEREPLTEILREPLAGLKHAGVTVVLDDYGNGYANSGVLDLIQPDVVKTDRRLTRLAGEGDPERELTRCLEKLNRRPGLKILAEGVETFSELAWLRNRGVSLVQGYLTGRPEQKLQVSAEGQD